MSKREDLESWRREWDEVQGHRYDPGHWLGGNIHPFYSHWAAAGPSIGFGVSLLVVALTAALVCVFWPPERFRLALGIVSIFLFVLGISNVRAAPRRRGG
jgi:hypothetical protein